MRRYIRKVNMLGSFNPTTTERRAARGARHKADRVFSALWNVKLSEMEGILSSEGPQPKWQRPGGNVVSQRRAQHFFDHKGIVVSRLRLGGRWTRVKSAMHERPDELGEQKQKKPVTSWQPRCIRAPPCSGEAIWPEVKVRSSRPTPAQAGPGGQISISRSRRASGGQTVSTSSSW